MGYIWFLLPWGTAIACGDLNSVPCWEGSLTSILVCLSVLKLFYTYSSVFSIVWLLSFILSPVRFLSLKLPSGATSTDSPWSMVADFELAFLLCGVSIRAAASSCTYTSSVSYSCEFNWLKSILSYNDCD